MADVVRVNTRISSTLNDWLDKESGESGLTKSTIIMLAIENYYREKQAMKTMSDMGAVMEKLDELEKKLANVKEV